MVLRILGGIGGGCEKGRKRGWEVRVGKGL